MILNKNTGIKRKLTKYVLLFLLLQITITKSYKLSTTIIYTEMTNNNKRRLWDRCFPVNLKVSLMLLKNFINDKIKKVGTQWWY